MVAGLDKITGGQPLVLASRWVIPGTVIALWGLVECVIGWIVLTFVAHRTLRYLLTLLFATFIGVLAIEWLSGSKQCPCLGSASLPIEFVVLFDVLALISLLVFAAQWDRSRFAVDSAVGGMLGNLKFVVPVLFGVAVIFFGSLDSAFGYFSGRSLLVTPMERFVGQIEVNKQATATFRLRNASSLPIRIVGARASCGCVAIEDLPVTVPAWESKAIRISLKSMDEPGLQRETATLICDDSASQLVLGVTALVHPNLNAVDVNSSLGEK